MTKKIAILNYNIGNLASVKNAISLLGVEADIIRDASKIKDYDKLILPGVGAFENAMNSLNECGMSEAIIEFAHSGRGILGICLGMQLLFEKSYEFGEHSGLGLLEGEVVKFQESHLKVPHMGWNKIDILKQSPILDGIESGSYLYFVHSFCVKDSPQTIATSQYGEIFSAIVQQDNIIGIQPHPEKSSQNGLKILDNFIRLV